MAAARRHLQRQYLSGFVPRVLAGVVEFIRWMNQTDDSSLLVPTADSPYWFMNYGTVLVRFKRRVCPSG